MNTPKSSLFGSNSTNQNVFGMQNQTSQVSGGTMGLFGQTQSQPKSLFGTTTQSTGTTAFGQSVAGNTTTSLFGQNTQQPQSNFFTSPVNSMVVGTTIKFDPVKSTDTMIRNNETKTINTKLMCISSMKQYDNKSLEVIYMPSKAPF